MPTLSEQRARQRAAKRKKQVERACKKQPKRNKLLESRQRKNRDRLCDAARRHEYCNKTESDQRLRENEAAYNDLVYYRNVADNLNHFIRLVFACRYALKLYEADKITPRSPWLDTVGQAAEALDKVKHLHDASPNQRRAALGSLKELCFVVYGIECLLPKNTLEMIARYGTGMQIREYAARFLELPREIRESLLRIINGETLRTCAKEYGIKENRLRHAVIVESENIYRIAECDIDIAGIRHADTIPELRTKHWQKLGHATTIAQAAKYAMTQICAPIEQYTGIIGGRSLEQRELAISKKILKGTV